VIGDVAGRGLQAATVMVQLRSALRAFAVEDPRPAEVLRRLSHHTLALELADLVTVLVALVDPAQGCFTFASAGHPPPLLLPPDGEPRIEWTTAGPPIGAPMAGHEEFRVDLPPGTTVLLYTDGLVEERGISLDQTLEQLRRSASGPHADLDALCDRLVEERRLEDDTALLACRRLPLPAHRTPRFEHRFPAVPVSVSAARHAVARVAAAAGFDDDGLGKVKLAVSEAATNAVLHAYRDRPEPGELLVRAEVAEGELRVVIVDRGTGIRPRDDSPGLGLGLGMISALTTRVDFHNARPGTEVHMAWKL
jgi:anti-sigma regulatory factor (Ser/Thr protein kinase)